MLSAPVAELPTGSEWTYEPKWDGFRILVRADRDVTLTSRGARPMTRYFPEVAAAMGWLGARRAVLDGELILVGPDGLDFDALQQRLHPAASRTERLSQQTPAEYVAFDLLAMDGCDLRSLDLRLRRDRLRELLVDAPTPRLTPWTSSPLVARRWFEDFEGAGLDGVIAKRLDQPYLGGRRAWAKLKHQRSADCVLIGYRQSGSELEVGSLLLGLYDAEGLLHYVGHTSGLDARSRRELTPALRQLEAPPPAMGRAPGGVSRWSRGRDARWISVQPTLVCEVSFDKLQSGERFRHAARLLRWRTDRDPRSCTFDQIRSPLDFDLDRVFNSGDSI